MVWQLRQSELREAIRALVDRWDGRCALVGTVGVQVHLAAAVGLEKPGPPARSIEVVAFSDAPRPDRSGVVPVELVDALGFEASIEAARVVVDVGGEKFPVASPEHIIGTTLGRPELHADAKWACFVLMRICEGRLDLEEARGFLKRCDSVERQSLLAELAYLAA